MKKEELRNLIRGSEAETDALRAAIKKNWDTVAKPLDGLGLLEDMVCIAGAAQGSIRPVLSPRALVIMCADNGIVKEGVSQSGQEVTLAVAKNMARGNSSACRMAAACRTDVFAVDIGINSDEEICDGRLQSGGLKEQAGNKVCFLQKKIMHATRSFAEEPAMSEEECMRAVETGMELSSQLAKKGYKILATGEMGIGNTTTSTAVACALLGLDPSETAGRGAGLDDAGLNRKIKVIRSALEKYSLSEDDAFEILRTLGGLDIAGLCGVFLGGALNRVPVVIDGLISGAAALCAARMVPGAGRYMLASHCGKEPAMKYILEELGLEAPVHARLALGEGTGALMVFPLLDMALEVYETGGSFENIGVKQYSRYNG